MLRLATALLLTLAAVLGVPAATADQANESSPQCVGLSVEPTFLCVSLYVHVTGADHLTFVTVDWGDGTSSDWVEVPCAIGCIQYVPHTYAAEGSYEITVTDHTTCGASNTVTAAVHASPEFTLYSRSQGDNWIQLATSEALETEKLRRSTVDWGDGSAIEEFDWFACEDGILCMPLHEYASPGEYSIEARIEYLGAWEGTCYERVATVLVTIGTSTPVQHTTWGHVKTLYR